MDQDCINAKTLISLFNKKQKTKQSKTAIVYLKWMKYRMKHFRLGNQTDVRRISEHGNCGEGTG